MEYTAVEQTEIRFAVAARNNPQLNGLGVKSLQAYIAQQARATTLSREQITATVTQLTQQGRSEAQIKAITTAAIGLAEATGTDLRSASEEVAATYSGQARELGKLYPAIRQMTENDLRAGKAAEYLAQANRGVAEAMAGSVGGKLQQLKNAAQETMQSLGGALAPMLINALDAIRPMIEKIGEWIQANTQRIANFFMNIPQLAKIAFDMLLDIVARYITEIPEIVKNVAVALFHFQIDLWKMQLQMMVDIAKLVFAILWEPLRFGFETAIFWIKKGWTDFLRVLADLGNATIVPVFNSILSAIQNVINGIIDMINHIRTAVGMAKIGALPSIQIQQMQQLKVAPSAEKAPQFDTKTWEAGIKGALSTTFNDAWKAVQKQFADAVELAKAAGKPFEEVWPEYQAKLMAILNKGVGIAKDALDLAYKDPSANLLLAIGSNIKSELFAIEAMYTDVKNPNKVTGYQQTSGVGLLGGANPLTTVLSTLSTFAASIAAITLLLNPISTILSATLKIITPVVNTILAPLVGFLTILGNTIGKILIPIFQALEPVITLISYALLYFYNYAIVPVADAIIFVANLFYDIIATIWNAIANAINAVLGWLGVHVNTMETKDLTSGFLSQITMAQMTGAGQASENGAGGTGAQAQYTGQQAIIVTVQNYFGTASVVGIDNFVAEIMRDIQAANATNQGSA